MSSLTHGMYVLIFKIQGIIRVRSRLRWTDAERGLLRQDQ